MYYKYLILDFKWFLGGFLPKKMVSQVHEGKKPFEYAVCSSKFSQIRDLKRQIEMVHEGKKPFECAVCSSEFSKIGDLKTHIGMVHEGKKSFGTL